MRRVLFVLVAIAGLLPGLDLVPRLAGWGAHGHMTAARAAVRTLPESMPAFFRAAEDQLVYLNPEPDRWRDRTESTLDDTMNSSFTPDHWIHLDEIPKELQEAENRYDFIVNLGKANLDPKEMGTLAYRIVEMTQRVRSGFRRWRQETDPAARQWIQQRIVNDAGILGHYVTDGSNPHHTSMHHNGWVGPNPRNFTPVVPEGERGGFHGRFEGEFTSARVTLEDVMGAAGAAPSVFPSVRTATWDHLRRSHARLIRLYELDQIRRFAQDNDSPEHKAFAVERLTAGAVMLRDLWWTAWTTSEGSAAIPPPTSPDVKPAPPK
jgi:hypothetical protein